MATESQDPRLSFIKDQVQSSFRVSKEAIGKCFALEKNAKCILMFLEEADVRYVVFNQISRDEILVHLNYPEKIQVKCVAVIKHTKVKSIDETFEDQLIFNDILPDHLQQLGVTLEQLVGSYLEDPIQFTDWPQVLVKDLQTHFSTFKSQFQTIQGDYHGKVVLTLPTMEELEKYETYISSQNFNNESGESNFTYHLEREITSWSEIFDNFAQENVYSISEEAKVIGPLAELNFWNKKVENITSIRKQLSSDEIVKVCELLNKTNNTYAVVIENIAATSNEYYAKFSEIAKYLNVLKPDFESLENFDNLEVVEMKRLLLRIVLALKIVFSKCEYLKHSYSHLFRLLTYIFDAVLKKLKMMLINSHVFTSDSNDVYEVINNLSNVTRYLKDLLLNQDQYPMEMWNFEDTELLEKVDVFGDKLEEILFVIDTFKNFVVLEKLEIAGQHGAVLSKRLDNLLEEFNGFKTQFQALQEDYFDQNYVLFKSLYVKFKKSIDQMVAQLSTIFLKTFESYSSLAELCKLVTVFSSLFVWDEIFEIFLKLYSRLLELFEQELNAIEEIFTTQKEDPPIASAMPQTSGQISWAYNLRQKLTLSFNLLNNLKLNHIKERFLTGLNEENAPLNDDYNVLFNCHLGDRLLKQYTSFLKEFDEFEMNAFVNWSQSIDTVAFIKLKDNLLKFSDEEVCLDDLISKEEKLMKKTKELRKEVDELTDQNERKKLGWLMLILIRN
eukprot:TRINITY_DN83_c0_g1_i1.p1 TRINITY_DN83_c0_g1~~TRINITY_DN83_c0_g1_i1.p1  ORF type:complete len:737 (+),score=220.77 TRINITY_DN83_c0_g1_i1:32-2212(+)